MEYDNKYVVAARTTLQNFGSHANFGAYFGSAIDHPCSFVGKIMISSSPPCS